VVCAAFNTCSSKNSLRGMHLPMRAQNPDLHLQRPSTHCDATWQRQSRGDQPMPHPTGRNYWLTNQPTIVQQQHTQLQHGPERHPRTKQTPHNRTPFPPLPPLPACSRLVLYRYHLCLAPHPLAARQPGAVAHCALVLDGQGRVAALLWETLACEKHTKASL
jgi:hypothetical protein